MRITKLGEYSRFCALRAVYLIEEEKFKLVTDGKYSNWVGTGVFEWVAHLYVEELELEKLSLVWKKRPMKVFSRKENSEIISALKADEYNFTEILCKAEKGYGYADWNDGINPDNIFWIDGGSSWDRYLVFGDVEVEFSPPLNNAGGKASSVQILSV